MNNDGRAFGLHFLGGRGTCLADDYVTRGKSNHYREIACYVVGAHGGSVVVAAALVSSWPRYLPEIEQAISSYSVS